MSTNGGNRPGGAEAVQKWPRGSYAQQKKQHQQQGGRGGRREMPVRGQQSPFHDNGRGDVWPAAAVAPLQTTAASTTWSAVVGGKQGTTPTTGGMIGTASASKDAYPPPETRKGISADAGEWNEVRKKRVKGKGSGGSMEVSVTSVASFPADGAARSRVKPARRWENAPVARRANHQPEKERSSKSDTRGTSRNDSAYGQQMTLFDIIDSKIKNKGKGRTTMVDTTASDRLWQQTQTQQQQKIAASKKKKKAKKGSPSVNPCSDVEVVLRGKATNKKKKPSKMKTIILLERQAAAVEQGILCEPLTAAPSPPDGNTALEEPRPGLPVQELSKLPPVNERAPILDELCVYERKQVRDAVAEFLAKLVRFQSRARSRDPEHASSKRRFVAGLREAKSFGKQGKIKVCLLARDIEGITVAGGLNSVVTQVVNGCKERNVPIVCALSRRQLSRAAGATAKLSIVAVTNYDGAEAELKNIFRTIEECKKEDELLKLWLGRQDLDEWGRPLTFTYKRHPSTANVSNYDYILRIHPTRPWMEVPDE